MHDKSQVSDNPSFALPDHHLITLDGRDAAVFAQAQFMNDLNSLQPGQWHWNGWLSPKGRVLTLFALLKWSEQRIGLLVPDADAIALVEGLKRFLFRSKAAIEVRGDLQVTGAFAAPDVAHGNAFSDVESDGVELDMGAESGPRCLRIIPREQPPDVHVALDETCANRWKAFDLEHGLPRLPASQVEHWTPQQLSLERLRGFSVKKGCYPGQEIVARTHFLGKAKRGLALLESDRPMSAGNDVHGEGAVVGGVTASADADGRHIALAVLSLSREAVPLTVADQPVRETPFKSGLER